MNKALRLTPVFAVILTALTGIMGAPFLRVMFKTQGSMRYWVLGVLSFTTLTLVQLEVVGLMLISIWITIGVFSELEKRGLRWTQSSLLSLVSATTLTGLAAIPFLRKAQIYHWTDFLEKTAVFLQNNWPQATTAQIDLKVILQQAPSVFVMVMMASLGSALIFEGNLLRWAQVPLERTANQIRLLEFRLPDVLVWFALGAMALALIDFQNESLNMIGLNFLNIAAVLYFFQGLAVTEVAFRILRVSPFMRTLGYFIIIGQLFFILSALGLVDYWLDLRRKMRTNKKKALLTK